MNDSFWLCRGTLASRTHKDGVRGCQRRRLLPPLPALAERRGRPELLNQQRKPTNTGEGLRQTKRPNWILGGRPTAWHITVHQCLLCCVSGFCCSHCFSPSLSGHELAKEGAFGLFPWSSGKNREAWQIAKQLQCLKRWFLTNATNRLHGNFAKPN